MTKDKNIKGIHPDVVKCDHYKSLKETYPSFKEEEEAPPPSYVQVSDGRQKGWVDPREMQAENVSQRAPMWYVGNAELLKTRDRTNDPAMRDLFPTGEPFNVRLSAFPGGIFQGGFHMLSVVIKSEYGNRRIYPNCKDSQLFSMIGRDKSNKRTIRFEDVPYILALGYQFSFIGDLPEDHEKIRELCEKFEKEGK